MTIIIHTGGDPGTSYWVDTGGHFTNMNHVDEDSDFYAESDIDGAGFGGSAFVLAQKRALPDVEPDIDSFNLLEMGHGGSSVIRFTPDGHPILLPNPSTGVTVYDDEKIPGIDLRPGPTAPTFKAYKGNVFYDHYGSNPQQDEGHCNIQLSHMWRPGSLICIHAHIGLKVAPGANDLIKFELEYFLSQVGAAASGNVTLSKEVSVGGLAQYTEILIEFDDIDMTGYLESTNIGCRFRRVAASANDYSAGAADAALMDFDAHIQKEKLGTRNAWAPFGK